MAIVERLSGIVVKQRESDVQAVDGRLAEWLKPSETVNLASLYLVNTRLWLDEMKQKYGRVMTIGRIPDSEFRSLYGDYVWFMGIYKPSEASRDHAKQYDWQYRYALPDIDRDKDVVACPFAIPSYEPNPLVARDWREWDRMVAKMHRMGKKVIIDFVPNHSAIDHPWARQHPEYYIQGSQDQYRAKPDLFCVIEDDKGQRRYLAHGKDPNSSEWADTLQLNYANRSVNTEMERVLFDLSKHADGVRCDMAMLIDPETFLGTWGKFLSEEERAFMRDNHFWRRVNSKLRRSGFKLIAEAYSDEEELRGSFDYLYHKRLYDHLVKVPKEEGPFHLRSHIDYLSKNPGKSAVFVENHDEERSVKTMGRYKMAAAALAGLIPGCLFLVNRGQEMGYMIRPPMQIGRQPNERVDEETKKFYENLMKLRQSKLYQRGSWRVDMGNYDDNLVAWMVESGDRSVCAINCVNMGRNEGRYSFDTRNGQWMIYDLIKGSYSQAQNGGGRGEMRLSPGEVKVVFLINEGKSSRRNLRF